MVHAFGVSLLLCACLAASETLAPPTSVLPALGLEPSPRWQGIALDSGTKRFYLPCATGVLVLDLEGRTRGRVPDLFGAQAVGLAPELGIGFASNPRANTVSVFNLETLQVEKQLRTTGAGPRAVLFEPATRRIFAFNQGGRNATAFDAYGGAAAGSIKLGGSPGPAVADGLGRLYASVGERGEVELLDARRLSVLQHWQLPGLGRPLAMALDPGRGRLFLLGRDGLLGVLDTRSGRLLATLAVGVLAAGVVCDPETGRVYVSGGDGELAVVAAQGSEGYARGARIAIRAGASAMVLDPQTHLLYLPFAPGRTAPLEAPEPPGFQVQVVAPAEGDVPVKASLS